MFFTTRKSPTPGFALDENFTDIPVFALEFAGSVGQNGPRLPDSCAIDEFKGRSWRKFAGHCDQALLSVQLFVETEAQCRIACHVSPSNPGFRNVRFRSICPES